ncbi:MAG: SEC-C domain-containing protein, partial [Hylemonella sp.]|nr:SEC-C domain-containing protein [Hylemonella sp.]
NWYRPIGLLGEDDFGPQQDALTTTPDLRGELALQIPQAVIAIYEYWLPYRQALYEREVAKTLQKKVGRNEPCPCGSEKKFKQCCGAAVNLH